MSDKPTEEPKLIIDEDWKTQVQRERDALKHKEAQEAQATPPTDSQADSVASPEKLGPPPPATLTLLVTTLATQAMAALGLMPDDQGEPLPVNLAFAKHFIDLIGVLDEKCKGNLEADEKRYIDDALYQLRLAFVEVGKQSKTQR